MSGARKRRMWRLSRRGFMIGAGVTGAGLLLGFRFGVPAAQLKIAETVDTMGGMPANPPRVPDAWFELQTSGRIRLLLSKVEMGQGVHTALAQIAAEELGIGLARIDVVQATTNQGVADTAGTASSNTISSLWEPLREASATLRVMIFARAAAALGVAPSAVAFAGDSVESVAEPTRRVPLAMLFASSADWQVPKDKPVLKRADFKVVGQPVARVDIPAKVTGQAVYGYDARVPGMLYGAVARPPSLGASLRTARQGTAAAADGVVAVVTDTDFAGVAATSRLAAQRAIGALDLTWDERRPLQQDDIDAMVLAEGPGGVTIQSVGNAPVLLADRSTHSAEYRTPLAIQTPLEAQAALADVRADRATIWASTQAPYALRTRVASAIGMKPEQVEVITTYLGGGFGRKSQTEAPIEAARLSKAAGAPVHMAWTRGEELQHGFLRPPTHHRLSARLSGDGRIEAIRHQQASANVLFTFFPGIARSMIGADFGAYRGALVRYTVPNIETVAWRADLPVRTGPWRGLGLLANTFAVESFMDELAEHAVIDPLEFRLRNLGDDPHSQRLRKVLQAAAAVGGWGTVTEPGRARGIACASDVDTVVAHVAEVSLEAATGRIRVHRITCAIDAGLTVNPDIARAQAEGGIMWGVGSTLFEQARIVDGRVDAANFDRYPVLRMEDAPDVRVELLESDGKPRGLGEPPMGPTSAAIANAVRALTGRRLRTLPFTPERMLDALRS